MVGRGYKPSINKQTNNMIMDIINIIVDRLREATWLSPSRVCGTEGFGFSVTTENLTLDAVNTDLVSGLPKGVRYQEEPKPVIIPGETMETQQCHSLTHAHMNE